MSDDLYDSLEDECNDNRDSSNSLDLLQTKVASVKRVSKLESINRYDSLCSEKHASNETDFSSNKVAVNASHRNNFLPTIINKNSMPDSFSNTESVECSGLQELFNHSADYETLAKKGLLLNRDGSFTKSVSDTEELPFITREYKNLVFQKHKTNSSKKPNSVDKTVHTTRCNKKKTWNGDFGKLLSNKQCVNALQKKNCEESNINFGKNSAMNLTDSMKTELLQNNQRSRQRSLEKKNAKQNAKLSLSETGALKDKFLDRTESKTKDLYNFSKQIPQFGQNNQRRHLTYLERHQLQNGYNPLFLRPENKKIISDTTRANFGDLMTGKLSDVSSRVLSVENLTDSENEEKFYKEIIEKEKNRTTKAQRSSIVMFSGKRVSAIGSSSLRDLKKFQGSDRSSGKQILKPLSIDIKQDGESATKKCSHYCTKDSSPKMSKTELALKAKTYGYLANARNIFKFKSRAEEKASGREDVSPKFTEVCKPASETTLKNVRKSLPSLNLAKKVRSGFEQSSGRINEVGSRGAEDCTLKKGEKLFHLPHVTGPEYKVCKVKECNQNKLKIVLPWLSI